MERLTERDDKGNLLFNGKQVYAGDFYEAVSCLEEYEDTGLTPPEIMELVGRDAAKDLKDLEKENVAKDELRKSFVNHIADILIGLNGAAKTEAEKELVFSIAVTVKDNIEFIPDGEES